MKYTLLDATQTILSSLDAEAINSINDTPEALQVVTCLRTAYYDLVNRSNLPEDFLPFNLMASSATTPTQMSMPIDFDSLTWIKYNVTDSSTPNPTWADIGVLPWDEFARRMYSLDPTDSNTGLYNITIGNYTLPIMYTLDHAPQYYSTFDDQNVIFDSIDTSVESFLASSKSLAQGRKIKTWTSVDTFVPDMQEDQFQLWLHDAKALAWAELKQTIHQKAEGTARKLKIAQLHNKKSINTISDFDALPNFGRN